MEQHKSPPFCDVVFRTAKVQEVEQELAQLVTLFVKMKQSALIATSAALTAAIAFAVASRREKQSTESFVILVTGASAGLGKDAALQLLREGHVVYGAARRVANMQDIVEAGGKIIKMDVTREADIVAGVTQIIKEQGKIDVLVNNAGIAVFGPVEDISMEDARRQFDVNLFGLSRLTNEVLPHMRERRSGKIINISSMAGKIYFPFAGWYVASKHALEGLSDCLRCDLQQFGIKVVIIEPGVVESEITDIAMAGVKERMKGSPYEKAIKEFFFSEDPTQGSHPKVVSDMISRVVKSANPKRRYVGGAMAGPLLFMRNALGDGLFDKMMTAKITQS